MDDPSLDGLMESFQYHVGKPRGTILMTTFGTKKSLREMFTYFWHMPEAHRYLEPTRGYSEKSEADAERLRNQGSMYYKRKQYTKALEYFTLSILAAPHPMEQESMSANTQERGSNVANGHHKDLREYKALAWGYSNRSAVLLILKEYGKCLQDIELALKYCDSDVMQNKLAERKRKCMEEQTHVLRVLQGPEIIPKIEDPNPSIPALSNAVKMAFTPAKGRHLVATRDIRPGELLGVEESYCHYIDSEFVHSFCCICIAECQAPLPCPSCSRVVYCSFSCLAIGQREHGLECSLLPSFMVLRCPSKHIFLTYKMLSRTPYSQLKEVLPQLYKEEKYCPKLTHGFGKSGKYRSDYSAVFHLLTNHEKRDTAELFSHCITAFILNKLLQQTGTYFVDEQGKTFSPTEDDLLMTGEVLLRYLLQVDCNNHPVAMMKKSAVFVENTKLGTGMYPTLCLMNHSCHPTAMYYSCGRTIVLRSVRSIPEGGEITECYGSVFYMLHYTLRRKNIIDNYQMTCTCEACEKKWLCLSSLPDILVKCVVCQRPLPMKASKCSGCYTDYRNLKSDKKKNQSVKIWLGYVHEIKGTREKFNGLQNKLRNEKVFTEEDAKLVVTFIELLENYAHVPCELYCDALQLLENLYKIKTYHDKQLCQ